MPRLSKNLGLFLPEGHEYFNINTWNTNMQKLDAAYALLRDGSGLGQSIDARLVLYDNNLSDLDATNVQDAIDELAQRSPSSTAYFIDVTENMTITVATYAHAYFVLSFGPTVYNVTFVQSIPDSGKQFTWEGGEPYFEPNSVYELSFLHLDCKWFKR